MPADSKCVGSTSVDSMSSGSMGVESIISKPHLTAEVSVPRAEGGTQTRSLHRTTNVGGAGGKNLARSAAVCRCPTGL